MRIVFILLSVVVLLLLYRWAAPETGIPTAENASVQELESQPPEELAQASEPVLADSKPLPESQQPVYYLQFLDGLIASARLAAVDDTPGELTPGVAVLDLRGGQTLLLRVLSDKKEELHLHGYDVHLHLKPGEEGQLKLDLKHTGRFELELHGAHRQLAVLEVRPAA